MKEIERDRYGMGVAANVLAADGQVMRTVGVHAVAGASLPGFERHAGRVDAERRLTVFVLRQKELAEERGWLLIVLGDLNSVCSPTKDIWGGTHVRREGSLAWALENAGVRDGFLGAAS